MSATQTCGNCRCLGSSTSTKTGKAQAICMLNPPVMLGSNTENRREGVTDCYPVWGWPETNAKGGWCSHWAPQSVINYSPPRSVS